MRENSQALFLGIIVGMCVGTLVTAIMELMIDKIYKSKGDRSYRLDYRFALAEVIVIALISETVAFMTLPVIH